MIYEEEYIQQLYDMLEPLRDIEQDKQWHPEESCWNHSFQTLHHALRETDDTDLILAALMHDVGKSVNKLGHDKEAIVMLADLLPTKGLWFISQHMRINDYLSGQMKKAKKAVDLATHPWFPKLVALNRWDKMGRKPNCDQYISAARLSTMLNKRLEKHFKPRPDNLCFGCARTFDNCSVRSELAVCPVFVCGYFVEEETHA